ncbi:biopolymer transporter ExbD [candidate division KSB1 bacterium]|nr:biopolymer transporter ExbD [bacterium]RKY80772.1 MAG: biopolymer transporter ExbD [candidate division KSB1 bacterium]HEC31373.1 biopolymer transporter ExbD [Deltaproteobacteria bacterium]RKY81290.1 MAG: biopolymer transporter ExbD [candidate division KSB1 bacterium]RKY84968.1 MAG: biopolymer transporter ExbD [candidate division KSB1 bacterium]
MMMSRTEKERTAQIPTASLADIAFLLLTFFLVTTTIDVDRGIGLTLPPKGQEQKIRKENICNVLINDIGQVAIDNQIVQIPMIKDVIKQKITNNPKLIISVKTALNTRYDIYIAVLDQLKRAGATRISIAEPEKIE